MKRSRKKTSTDKVRMKIWVIGEFKTINRQKVACAELWRLTNIWADAFSRHDTKKLTILGEGYYYEKKKSKS